MRIGALVHMYPPMHNAGAEHMLHAMLSELVRRGHRASVAVSAPRVQPFAPYTLDGVRVGGVEMLDGCDIVLTHLDRTEDAERYCRRNGKPCVQIFHNHLRPKTATLVNLAIYNSEWLARDFPVKSPSLVVPPPIWPDRYRVKPGDCITLINLTEAKGARLFYALAASRPDLEFLGVRGAYGRQIEPPRLENLTVIDTCEDVRDVYSRTRVLLVPSAYESYGRVAVEAIVSGIPVIATGTPGLHEALDDAGVFPHEAEYLALGRETPLSVLPAWKAALDSVLADWEAYSARALKRSKRLDPHGEMDQLEDALGCLLPDRVRGDMDAVYLCRGGENEELRYSLRSLAANVPHDRVWLFGEGPRWFTGERVNVAQTGSKQENATRALLAACMHPEVSDPFILMNDDFFALEPSVVELLDRGPMRDVLADVTASFPRNGEIRRMTETQRLLEARGISDPLSFELHVPMPVRKDVMLEALKLSTTTLHWRSIYGALCGDASTTIADVKVCRLDDDVPTGPWLSTNDSTFGAVSGLLRGLFPQRCVYEKENTMVKVRVIQGFTDRQAGRRRRIGETFEATPARVSEINATDYGQLVELVDEPGIITPATPVPQTVADIKAILDARGVVYRGNAKKADLLKLL